MKFIEYKKEDYQYRTNIYRTYMVCELSISDFTKEEKDKILSDSKALYELVNDKGASTGKKRTNIPKWNDCVAGVLSEFGVQKFLSENLENVNVLRPEAKSGKNQIDLVLQGNKDKNYEIEVRSSFVNNGIPFALYGVDKETSKNYFDVLGPYKQTAYKYEFESVKDIFFRVLFNGKKDDVENRFVNKNESFYIIGAMIGKDLVDLNYKKDLSARDAFNINPGEYYVAPMLYIKDTKEIIDYLRVKLE